MFFEKVSIPKMYYLILIEILNVKMMHKNHKLLCGQCYHTFSSDWNVYLLKNQNKFNSSKMIPAAIFWCLAHGLVVVSCPTSSGLG